MFLSRNKKNNVYLCKPHLFLLYKVEFKGIKLYRYFFAMWLTWARMGSLACTYAIGICYNGTSHDATHITCARNLIISYRPYQRWGLLAVAVRQVSHLRMFPALFRDCLSCSADTLVNKWPGINKWPETSFPLMLRGGFDLSCKICRIIYCN